MDNKRKRFMDIDYAKGIAIILVVLGHVVARDFPEGNSWFVHVKTTIYFFHMAFFMFLSGWIFYHTMPVEINRSNVAEYIGKRAFRLLLPFILFAIVVILGKSISAQFFMVDNSFNSLADAFKSVIWNTGDSKVTFIWYIYVLFVFNMLTIFFLKLTRNNIILLLISAFILTFIKVPQVMYLDYIFKYYFYFILGCWIVTKHGLYYKIIENNKYYIILAFLISIFIVNINILPAVAPMLVSIAAIPSLHYFANNNFTFNKLNFLQVIGKYSLTIYLFNVIFIGVVKGIMFKFINWDYANFLVYLPVLFLAGLVLPIFFWDIILSKIPIIKKITI